MWLTLQLGSRDERSSHSLALEAEATEWTRWLHRVLILSSGNMDYSGGNFMNLLGSVLRVCAAPLCTTGVA